MLLQAVRKEAVGFLLIFGMNDFGVGFANELLRAVSQHVFYRFIDKTEFSVAVEGEDNIGGVLNQELISFFR